MCTLTTVLLSGSCACHAVNAGLGIAVGSVASLISLGIYIWAFVELGCFGGTEGDNRFGPDPLAGKTGWAEYVNEAIVLGPNGEERWRHRKLSCAAAEVATQTIAVKAKTIGIRSVIVFPLFGPSTGCLDDLRPLRLFEVHAHLTGSAGNPLRRHPPNAFTVTQKTSPLNAPKAPAIATSNAKTPHPNQP